MFCPLTGKPCVNPKSVHVVEPTPNGDAHMFLCGVCVSQIEQAAGGVVLEVPPAAFSKSNATLKPSGVTPEHGSQSKPIDFQALMSTVEDRNREELAMRSPCPTCGHTLADVHVKGHLGCSDCYTFFKDQLTPLLRRCHENNVEHTGKVPASLGGGESAAKKLQEQEAMRASVESLESKLKAAVQCERYEDATKIHDQIKYLRGKLDGLV